MNYSVETGPYQTWVVLHNAANSKKDLIGKTIKNIKFYVDKTSILFTDGSCAIVDSQHEEFDDRFAVGYINFFGFLVGDKAVKEIKALHKKTDAERSLKYHEQQLAYHKCKLEEMKSVLPNN